MADAAHYLPGTHTRGHWLRVDVANILKRFFLCEQALIISQAGWLAALAPLDVKLTLPRFLWEDALTAHALRERVFELRFPSRHLEVGDDAPLVQIFTKALDAPGPEALVLSLARLFKPALLAAYQQYIEQTDEIADGPTLRFLQQAIQEKRDQIQQLSRFAAKMLAANPGGRTEAEKWVAQLGQHLSAVGGLSLDPPDGPAVPPEISGQQPFQLAQVPARDNRFYCCRFYWPDIIDPDFPYGDGVRLQLRSAISHLNEVWAVETAGAILHAFAQPLGWDFVFDAARWTYDESRHCRMGLERLQAWGFSPDEIPLGSYIYDSAKDQHPVYRLGMLYYFETKNIGKKPQRAKAFAQYDDRVSQHDMDFDWADEAIHAHYGRRWLDALHAAQPDTVPAPDAIRERCDRLVAELVKTASNPERQAIRAVALAMISKAKTQIS